MGNHNNVENDERQIYRAARRRVDRRIGFYKSLIVYIVINAILVLIWAIESGPDSNFWPIWVIGIWGFILALKFISVFLGDELFRGYRRRKIRKFVEQEKRYSEFESKYK